jgi:hypothetical protein
MRDNDAILLESLYTSLVLEDAQSQINQAINILKKANFEKTKQEKGGKIAPEEFEAFKVENQRQSEEIANQLKEIIDQAPAPRENPNFGKGYEYIPALATMIKQGVSIREIGSLYNSYASIDLPEAIKNRRSNLINKILIPNSGVTANEFGTIIHALEGEVRNLQKSEAGEEEIKKTSEGDFSQEDSNNVYEDENIIVLKATTGDISESIKNCQKYGQGEEHGLCISGSSRIEWYLRYRFRDGLTTYFVYFKKPNENAKEGFIIVDRVDHDIAGSNMEGINYQYNVITSNNDIKVPSAESIVKIYPELARAFKQDAFEIIPLVGEELEIKDKVYNANSIFEPQIINNIDLIKAFLIIHEGSFKRNGGSPKVEDLEKLKEAIPNRYEEILHVYLEDGPQLEEEVYNFLKPQQQKRWETMRLRKIEQAFGLTPENNQEENQD